jgi:hypothetical protein
MRNFACALLQCRALEMTSGGKHGKPKSVFHPSHRSWKSLWDSHIPNTPAAGDILISDRALPAFTQNQSHFLLKGL